MVLTSSQLNRELARSDDEVCFAILGKHLNNPGYLSRIKQRDDETLQVWLERFTKAIVEVGHLSDDALLLAAISVVCEDTLFAFSTNKKLPRMYSNFLDRARNYVNAEALTSKKSGATKTSRADPKRTDGRRRKDLRRPPQEEAVNPAMIRCIAIHILRTRPLELVVNGTARTLSLPPRLKKSSSTPEARLTFDPCCQ